MEQEYPKLQFYKVKKNNNPMTCCYCQKPDCTDMIRIHTPNAKIFEFFDRPQLGNAMAFYLCPECFEKLRELLEEIESEGYSVLDEDSEEFKGLDEEIEENDENGSGC